MRDQAHQLRSLKMETALADSTTAVSRPRTVVVTGGKGGVGISTLAVNLAASLSRQGNRVLIASTGPQPHDVAMICGLTDYPESADGLQPVQGPAGLLILPQCNRSSESHGTKIRRVFEAIGRLGNCVDLAIVDAGNRFATTDPWLLAATDTLLYVTTSDNVAVMDTYAAIKDLVGRCQSPEAQCDESESPATVSRLAEPTTNSSAVAIDVSMPPLALLVNRCHATDAAHGTHDRIAATCRRFLRTSLKFVGEVPDDSSLCTAQTASLPAVVQSPTSAAAKAIGRAAALVTRT